MLALALAYLGTSAGLYTVSIWTPQIIARFGYGLDAVGLLSAVPSLFAAFAMVAWARRSDRTGERHLHAAAACFAGALGMGLVACAWHSAALTLVGLSFTACGVNAAKPPLWVLPTTFLAGSDAAAGIGLINSLGTLGGSIGPYLVGAGRSDGYGPGLLTVGGTLILSALVILALRRTVIGRQSPHAGDRSP